MMVSRMAPPFPPAPLSFSSMSVPTLDLRPRRVFVVAAVVVPVLLLALLLKLSYDAATFDPRIALFAVYAVAYGVAAVRARVRVSDGVLWRRSLGRYSGVRLDALDAVVIGRARYLRREGVLRTILRVSDRDGRSLTLKPAVWQRHARPRPAGLATLAAG